MNFLNSITPVSMREKINELVTAWNNLKFVAGPGVKISRLPSGMMISSSNGAGGINREHPPYRYTGLFAVDIDSKNKKVIINQGLMNLYTFGLMWKEYTGKSGDSLLKFTSGATNWNTSPIWVDGASLDLPSDEIFYVNMAIYLKGDSDKVQSFDRVEFYTATMPTIAMGNFNNFFSTPIARCDYPNEYYMTITQYQYGVFTLGIPFFNGPTYST